MLSKSEGRGDLNEADVCTVVNNEGLSIKNELPKTEKPIQ